ncbi:hypothetical protein Q7C36_012998 [Tachysurus vachellii]|uniref:Uncharacterized protein n=1 Tax=Tachysurus vachellii TaxID=175792 RepID=A0AA88MQQ0_TACVA|nr:hypothetical protein Q7C36_012998 [Tachysurus vachellii]
MLICIASYLSFLLRRRRSQISTKECLHSAERATLQRCNLRREEHELWMIEPCFCDLAAVLKEL